MLNELINRQIVECHNQGIPAENIATELGVNIATVNLVLSAHGLGERDITDEQLVLLRQNAFELSMQREDISVAARMTQFLIERDKPRQVVQNSPLVVINQAISAAQERMQQLAKGYTEENVIPLQQ